MGTCLHSPLEPITSDCVCSVEFHLSGQLPRHTSGLTNLEQWPEEWYTSVCGCATQAACSEQLRHMSQHTNLERRVGIFPVLVSQTVPVKESCHPEQVLSQPPWFLNALPWGKSAGILV